MSILHNKLFHISWLMVLLLNKRKCSRIWRIRSWAITNWILINKIIRSVLIVRRCLATIFYSRFNLGWQNSFLINIFIIYISFIRILLLSCINFFKRYHSDTIIGFWRCWSKIFLTTWILRMIIIKIIKFNWLSVLKIVVIIVVIVLILWRL